MDFEKFKREVKFKKKSILFISVFMIIIFTISITYVIKIEDDGIVIVPGKNETETNSFTGNNTEKEIEEKIEQIKIYVVGAVKNPGVVSVERGSILDTVIKAAGGFTEDAAIDKINLVYELFENVMIRIKTNKEVDAEQEEYTNRHTSQGIEVIREIDNSIVIGGGSQTNIKIDINRATLEQLKTLPGIGDSTAANIITYRQRNGNFRRIEDIKNVSGIGDKKFEDIRELITVN